MVASIKSLVDKGDVRAVMEKVSKMEVPDIVIAAGDAGIVLRGQRKYDIVMGLYKKLVSQGAY